MNVDSGSGKLPPPTAPHQLQEGEGHLHTAAKILGRYVGRNERGEFQDGGLQHGHPELFAHVFDVFPLGGLYNE